MFACFFIVYFVYDSYNNNNSDSTSEAERERRKVAHKPNGKTKRQDQLQQRNRATRYASKFVLGYVSRAMGVIKISNSKSDLQSHSRALAMVSVDGPHTISYPSFVATMSLSCTVSEILSLIFQNLQKSHDSEQIPFRSNISYMQSYPAESISTRNLKCLASPITNI